MERVACCCHSYIASKLLSSSSSISALSICFYIVDWMTRMASDLGNNPPPAKCFVEESRSVSNLLQAQHIGLINRR